VPTEELVDKTLAEVGLPQELCKIWDDAIGEVFRAAEVLRIEFALPNGHWFDGLLMPEFDEQRRPRAVITTARDVTFRKRTDEERRKLTEQLQHAMKMEAVGRLAGGVAHDFNNLLTAIKGSISLALLDLEPNCAIADVLGEANKAADSAATLTRRLLAFSRKQPIEPQTINLNELISHMQQMLVRLIREDIELRTNFAEDLGSVLADQGQMEQILLNLVVNARDAMPAGGRLLLETFNIELDEEYQKMHPHTPVGRFVSLSVTDTGCGMTPEVKEHVFEPFFTTKAQGCGTGLGLATIYGAVRQAGGSIEVYSEVGVGTTFKIYLPRTDAVPERVVGTPSWGIMPGGNETVLLVEDDEVLRELTSKFLARLGYEVLTAPDGLVGLELARSYEGVIDLLLTDLVLPGINGRELSERIADLRPETKVLFTSGYTDDMIIRQEESASSFHFIGKPFALRAMANKLREVLG
jgi:signal transduction histidine kinase